MGCRCSDISKINSEISRLKKALNYTDDAVLNKVNTISELTKASISYEKGVIFNGFEEETALSIRKSYNKASIAILNAKNAISTAISRAESKLNLLKTEDIYYHDHKEHN